MVEIVSLDNIVKITVEMPAPSKWKYNPGRVKHSTKNFWGNKKILKSYIPSGFWNTNFYDEVNRASQVESLETVLRYGRTYESTELGDYCMGPNDEILNSGRILINYLDGSSYLYRSDSADEITKHVKDLKQRIGEHFKDFKDGSNN